MKSGPSLRKLPYTAQKNACITFGSRVRLAFENVLRFAGVMPRTRDRRRPSGVTVNFKLKILLKKWVNSSLQRLLT